ncbi:MAG TPA: IPT/TIG domain-containing protein [Mycobacteriales bacterium]|nr:IPT/TIG domain-containing protein [Mycobacteriales bacterium]
MFGTTQARPRAAYFAVSALAIPVAWFTQATHPAQRHQVPAPAVFTVSPNGGGEACVPAEPCSLATAQAQARALEKDSRYGVVVQLEGGTYHLRHAIRLTAADSGHPGAEVVYRAASGAHPVLSGGKRITEWRKLAGSPNWYADIPKGFDTRQLYVNGKRMPIARGLPHGRLVQTSTGMIATSTDVDSWKNPSNVQAVFRGGNGPWTQTSCPIASIAGTTVNMAEPCWNNLNLHGYGVQELAWFTSPDDGFGGLGVWKTPTTFWNLYSAMTPGTWSIDRVEHRLYYQPRKGQDLAKEDVVVPALQTLLSVDGTAKHPVHDLTIQGLTFEYGTWTAPDTDNGFPQMQADWYLSGPHANTMEGTCRYHKPSGSCPFASWTRTPANVVLRSTSRVSVVGNRFVHLGGAGLDLYRGAKHDLVQGNEFTDIAASGVQLGATNDNLPQKRYGGMRERFNTVADNFVHDVANQYLGGIGIWLGYTTHSHVVHNEIEHVPYTAISIGWGGWHSTVLAPNRNPNANAYNVVSNNMMYDYMHTLGDGGAIYSNGPQAYSWKTALVEQRNVAYRGTNTDFSFYTDAASQYVKIGGNFAYFQPIDSFNTGGCHTVGHIRIYNNYFAQGGPAYPCFLYTDMVKEKNTSVCENPMPAEAPVPIMRGAGLEPEFRQLVRQYRPEVNLVGPGQIGTAGGKILISGTGFSPSSVVRVGGRKVTGVKVISDNYIFATAPAQQGPSTVPVTVTNAQGVSKVNQYSQLTYAQSPEPCQLSDGSGFSTAIAS